MLICLTILNSNYLAYNPSNSSPLNLRLSEYLGQISKINSTPEEFDLITWPFRRILN